MVPSIHMTVTDVGECVYLRCVLDRFRVVSKAQRATYSALRATTGLTETARRAGMRQAAAETNKRRAAAAA